MSLPEPLKISIVEPLEHLEVVRYLYTVLSSMAECTCYLPLGSQADSIAADHLRRPRRGESYEDFLREALPTIAQGHIVVLVTFPLDPTCRRLLESLPVVRVACVHNVNYHFSADPVVSNTPEDVLRRLRWRYRGWWSARRPSESAWAGLVFPSIATLQSAVLCGWGGSCLAVPWAIAKPTGGVVQVSDSLVIVIPGTVRSTDRRWEPVKQAFVDVKRPVRLALLGETRGRGGRAIMDSLRRASPPNVEIVSFQSPVSERTYGDWLRQADVAILPLARDMAYATIAERGGVTKVSGGEHDCLAYGIPAFVDAAYSVNGSIDTVRYLYEDGEQLARLIRRLPQRRGLVTEQSRWTLEAHKDEWTTFLSGLIES